MIDVNYNYYYYYKGRYLTSIPHNIHRRIERLKTDYRRRVLDAVFVSFLWKNNGFSREIDEKSNKKKKMIRVNEKEYWI